MLNSLTLDTKKIYKFLTTKLLANFHDLDIFRKNLNFKCL